MCAQFGNAPVGSATQPCPKTKANLVVVVMGDGRPIGQAQVKVQGPTPGQGATEEAHGAKGFKDIKPGRYSASATLPPAWSKDFDPPKDGSTTVAAGSDGMITLQARKKAAPVTPAATPLTWIIFRVVFDDTAEPVPGVTLTITSVDGKKSKATTNSFGEIKVENLKPGSCEIQSEFDQLGRATTVGLVGLGPVDSPEPPAEPRKAPASTHHLASLVWHKVTRSDSLVSLAGRCRVHWKDLSRLNFGTDKPTEVNRHLRFDVGCTRRTADGHNYMFDDSDRPGLMLLPQPIRQGGFATQTVHILRVSRLPPLNAWRFSL